MTKPLNKERLHLHLIYKIQRILTLLQISSLQMRENPSKNLTYHVLAITITKVVIPCDVFEFFTFELIIIIRNVPK